MSVFVKFKKIIKLNN